MNLALILSALLSVLGISLWFATDKMTVIFTLASAMVGGLTAVLGEQYFRQREDARQRRGAISALRAEVELNLGIEAYGSDEKLRGYSTASWQLASQYILDLKPQIYEYLRGGYELIHLHRQTLIIELIRTGYGDKLKDCTDQMKGKFKAALSEKEWLLY